MYDFFQDVLNCCGIMRLLCGKERFFCSLPAEKLLFCLEVCLHYVCASQLPLLLFSVFPEGRGGVFRGPPVKSTAVLHTGEEEETDREKKER